ncbi:hypothetical protein C497_11618 [Halalkalicoccus jeotgali B3]|uniref:Uncharacterized protein n=2 Tax=Halalkalicoccus jeotgali TaxID=413810 RepID=D8J4X5_HALJB|nr:DUF5793 family protein [Halalkalicoccus jeotgali]ADJ15592.1 hypothetical protein HacjB3_11045 [Halalkalicoccus jeotgali B3]ELY36330.1 hypothetical protein C497_11618 [Halalkalicoccus jeotgali B3]
MASQFVPFGELMRRDYFTLDVRGIDWVEEGGAPTTPTVVIDFEGPADELEARLSASDDELLSAAQTDVALRLQGAVDDAGTTGVVSVTNRLTGDFVLELNEEAGDVLRFIRAARAYGKEADSEERYRVIIRIDGEELVTYEKSTFLVYDREGHLLRQHSLIPSGVEL